MDNDQSKDNSTPESSETSNTTPVQKWRPQDADREYYKQDVRRRVRNATIPEGTIFYPAKPRPTINDTGHKKVAVYARVSTKSKEQVSSIENQTKYYTEKIDKTPNWELQEIYSDEGKSGTSTRKRTEFLRMMGDASNKKMDLIVCASVSRFARNVSDCIEQVRILKTQNPSHPIGVYFETENIYTLDPESNQMFTMHAMLADWESANKSRRMILSYDQRICTGQYPVSDLLGYRHTKDGELIIEEDEAKTVRYIFLAYMYGYSCEEIAETLTEKQRPTLHGRTKWNAQMVKNIMSNERRWGDLNVRKTIVVDYVKGKTVRNTEHLRDSAFVPNHHDGIVTPQIAKAVHLLSSSRNKANGIPELYVINEGNLKGFVSICPKWEGIDDDTLLAVSKSVYSDEEYAEIERLSKSISVENSNENQPSFSGYEVPYSAYFISQNTPSLTISNKSIQFSQAAVAKMEQCKYIELLYNPILRMVAVRECEAAFQNAIQWTTEDNHSKVISGTGAFVRSIFERTGWYTGFKFKFKGVTRIRNGSKAILFYLDEPQVLVGKQNQQDLPIELESKNRYISCSAEPDDGTIYSKHAFPSTWDTGSFGLNMALRQKRDKLASELSDSDILMQGINVENPLIGSIPSRNEIWEELDKLLISM